MEYTINNYKIVGIEDGKELAWIEFPETDSGIITITHTIVDPSLQGRGIARELVARVIEYAKENGLKIKATCSYAVKYFEKNPNDLYIG